MIDYVKDDGGRREAGFKGRAGDCVARSAAIITGKPYAEVYQALAEAEAQVTGVKSARNGIHTARAPVKKALEALGLERVTFGKGVKPTLTEAHERLGDCMALIPKHVTAIVDGAVRDVIDCRVYHWGDPSGGFETRERKAFSAWIPRRDMDAGHA